jgi:hypothetical protein
METTFRIRLPKGSCGARKYRGSSAQAAPNPASIALLVEVPVSRMPYRLPKPSHEPPYSFGEFRAVPSPALKMPTASVSGPTVLLTNHFKRWPPVIGWYGTIAPDLVVVGSVVRASDFGGTDWAGARFVTTKRSAIRRNEV